MKNLDTGRNRKRNPHNSCSFFTHPTHDKKQTNYLIPQNRVVLAKL